MPMSAARRIESITDTRSQEEVVFNIMPAEVLKPLFHSIQYFNLIMEGLAAADFVDTYLLRIPGVVMTCLHNTFEVGPTIQFMCEHPALALGYTIGKIALCILGLDREFNKQARADKRKHLNNFLLQKALQELDSEHEEMALLEATRLSKAQIHNKNLKLKIEFFNKHLSSLLDDDLKVTFKAFELIPLDDKQKTVDLNEETEIFPFENLRLRVIAHKSPKSEQQPVIVEASIQDQNISKPVAETYPTRIYNTVLKPLWNKAIVPLWDKFNILRNTIFIAAFVYWIEWITAALFNGGQMGVGVVGMPPVLAFGIPLVFALPYACIATYHYIKNGEWKKSREEIEMEKEAKLQSENLMIAAAKKLEIEILEKEQVYLSNKVSEYKIDFEVEVFKISQNNILSFSGRRWVKLKAANSLVTTMISEEGLSQYVAWYVTDLLQIALSTTMMIPYVNTVVGSIFLGLTLVYGLIAMKKNYDQVQKEKIHKPEHEPTVVPSNEALEKKLKEHNQDLACLSREILKKRDDINSLIKKEQINLPGQPYISVPNCIDRARDALEPEVPEKGPLLRFFENKMTGMFFARCFFVAGSAIVLAFTVSTFGIGSIVAVSALGVAYATAKYFEEKQKNTAEKRKQLITTTHERDQQIVAAQMTLQNLQMKEKILKHKAELSVESTQKCYTRPPIPAESLLPDPSSRVDSLATRQTSDSDSSTDSVEEIPATPGSLTPTGGLSAISCATNGRDVFTGSNPLLTPEDPDRMTKLGSR